MLLVMAYDMLMRLCGRRSVASVDTNLSPGHACGCRQQRPPTLRLLRIWWRSIAPTTWASAPRLQTPSRLVHSIHPPIHPPTGPHTAAYPPGPMSLYTQMLLPAVRHCVQCSVGQRASDGGLRHRHQGAGGARKDTQGVGQWEHHHVEKSAPSCVHVHVQHWRW
jgi:hypothetical protein